jgi:hypothetical protein
MIETIRSMFYSPPQIPKTSRDFDSYQNNFANAVRFTKSCGFAVQVPQWKPEEKLDAGGSFLEPVLRAAGVRDVTKAAFQCLKWSHYLAPYFEQQLGREVWITLGQLWRDDRAIFSPTWKEFRDWSKRGISVEDMYKRGSAGLNLHAWLTIDTGEIIEPTMMTSIATLHPDRYPHFMAAIGWGYANDILSDHYYYPMAVGKAFVETIGEKSQVDLLASDAEDLHSYSTALVFGG